MNREKLIARHPELVALRQFKTNEEIMKVLQLGVTIYCTTINCEEPTEYIGGPFVVAGEWRMDDLGKRYVFVRHIDGHTGKIYLNDLQYYSLARGVFTTKERARAYYRACRARYEGDSEWRDFVAKERAESEWMWAYICQTID